MAEFPKQFDGSLIEDDRATLEASLQ